ncbi:MAG: hypothetical protein P8M73_11550 [Luminiphilus sp.]|nr:hypothetical protein [Luminiphilus sp.]
MTNAVRINLSAGPVMGWLETRGLSATFSAEWPILALREHFGCAKPCFF